MLKTLVNLSAEPVGNEFARLQVKTTAAGALMLGHFHVQAVVSKKSGEAVADLLEQLAQQLREVLPGA